MGGAHPVSYLIFLKNTCDMMETEEGFREIRRGGVRRDGEIPRFKYLTYEELGEIQMDKLSP